MQVLTKKNLSAQKEQGCLRGHYVQRRTPRGITLITRRARARPSKRDDYSVAPSSGSSCGGGSGGGSSSSVSVNVLERRDWAVAAAVAQAEDKSAC